MQRWPSKTAVQALCVWALWSVLPARVALSEKEMNARVDAWHGFADRAILRRSLIGHGLFRRTPDGSEYRRIEPVPPADALALIRAVTARQG